MLPDGWFPEAQCRVLYQLARTLPGPFMEIGSFVGRSTACICMGIRDSGTHKPFFTTDMHFDSAEQFLAHYQPIHGPHTQVPQKQLHYIETGGTLHHLQQNLEQHKLHEYVTILSGDFQQVMPISKYTMIFCDAAHDIAEVDRNIPRLAHYLQPGSVLVCDDVTNDSLADRIASHLNLEHVERDERLLIAVIAEP